MADRTCKIDGCETGGKLRRGWCGKHYKRWQIHGDPLHTTVIIGDDEARFWAHIRRDGDCWIWTAVTDRDGYGFFHADRVQHRAHRWSYEHFVGPIPGGLVIDHLCRRPPCVNPAHMEPVSNRLNILRGDGPSAENARKTHCVHGHLLSGENLYIYPGTGSRSCWTCIVRWRRAASRMAPEA